MNHDKAVNDFYRMADNLDKPKPKISEKQEYWQGQAIKLATKQSMAVVEIDKDHYQIWSLAKAGNDHVYVAEYVQEVTSNGD